MKICVNGIWREASASTLSDALNEFGYGSAVVATAVNGTFVATAARAATKLNDNDRIEILAPMQGG